MKILSYRPGCARRRTVFENQLLLYEELQRNHGMSFHHVVDQESLEPDERFEWTGLARREWESFRGRHWYLGKERKVGRIIGLARGCDGILTIDPTVYPQALLAFEAARKLDLPVSFVATITLLSEAMNSHWYANRYRLLKRLLAQCSAILVPSPKVIERFAHLKLLTPELVGKFHCVGHPIDLERFTPNPSLRVPGRFLCVTRLIPEKGIAYILEAFAVVAKNAPHASLRFIGEGMMRDWLLRRSEALGVRERVEIVPPVPHPELPALLQSGDIFVTHPLSMPWWEEYFGVASLEAMACGLVVISTTGGGVPFALRPPATFAAVRERDIQGLTQAMRDALVPSNDRRAHRLAANRDFVRENWSVTSVATQFPGIRPSGHLAHPI